jgi:hypothetical protein
MTQAKNALCHDQFLTDMFLPVVVEDFGCLHQEANGFLHQYANMAWAVKGTKGPLLSVLHAFYRQKMLMMLQHVQAVSILRHVGTIGEGLSKLGILLRGPPLSLFDVLLATKVGLGT